MTEVWAAVALGWRWSFTVCKPGLGIVTRVSEGGLKGRREGKEGAEPSSVGGKGGSGLWRRRFGGQRRVLLCKSSSAEMVIIFF